MKNHVIDLKKEYGVVLEGGGAKGAYQIGVWKAFLEYGVKIKGVSGVSVGALNGALICMGNYEEAENLWKNLTYSRIMNVDDEQMDKLIKRNIKELNMKELTKETTKMIADGGIDITPLKELINEWVDEEKICNSDIEFVLGAFLVSKLKEIEITAKEAEKAYLKDYLLASASLPAFRNDKLHGLKYLDGGMFNNVPINMLINRGYKDIIVVRIFGIGLERPVKIPDDVNVIQIAPRVNLGGILEFDPNRIRRNIKIGYYDAIRSLCNLWGKVYYIDPTMTEVECLDFFIHCNKSVKMALLEYYKIGYEKSELYTRFFLEKICPNLAGTLKLENNWTYRDLYLSILELAAKTLRIPKYNIYTEIELKEKIIKRYQDNRLKEENSFSLFHEIIIKMITITEE